MVLSGSIIGRLRLGLAVTLILAVLLGGLAIERTVRIGQASDRLLYHPFTVSNVALEIRLAIDIMGDTFGAMAGPASVDELRQLAASFERQYQAAQPQLDVLGERYLGERREVEALRAALATCDFLKGEILKQGLVGNWGEVGAVVKRARTTCLAEADRHANGIIRFARAKADSFLAEARATQRMATWTVAGLMAALFLFGGWFVWYLTRNVVAPLAALRTAMKRIVGGETAIPLPSLAAANEVGEMARAVDELRHHMVERRRAEANLRDAMAELTRTNQQLTESNRDLEAFAHASSHDLQEPLRAITSYVQLIERRLGETTDPDLEQYIEFVVAGTNRMRQLILDLLEYTRLRHAEVRLDDIPLTGAVESALTALRAEVRKAKATVTVGALPLVRGDSALLEVVFRHLIGNALAFRHPERPATVAITAEREGDSWIVDVADNGIGIDAAYWTRIFHAFARLNAREIHAGSGLGLAAVQHIVERHTGRVWVESTPDQGSQFRFSLPAASPSMG